METHKLPGGGGSDSGSAKKPDSNEILDAFNAIETTPATEQRVKGVQEEMRKRMNAALEQHGEQATGGLEGMHHPAGQKEVNIREGLEFKKFKETVKGLLNHQVETVQGSTRGRIYQVLGDFLPQLKAAATEPPKKDEEKKENDPDEKKVETVKYKPTTWYGKATLATLGFPAYVGKKVGWDFPRWIGKWAWNNLSIDMLNVFSDKFWAYRSKDQK